MKNIQLSPDETTEVFSNLLSLNNIKWGQLFGKRSRPIYILKVNQIKDSLVVKVKQNSLLGISFYPKVIIKKTNNDSKVIINIKKTIPYDLILQFFLVLLVIFFWFKNGFFNNLNYMDLFMFGIIFVGNCMYFYFANFFITSKLGSIGIKI